MIDFETREYEYFKNLEEITMSEHFGLLDPSKITVIRCDGCHFHTYTRGYLRPFDPMLHYCLDKAYLNTVKALFGNLWLCLYSQSDEVTIILYPKWKREDQFVLLPWGKLAKLTSIVPSRIAVEFHIQLIKEEFGESITPFYQIIGTDHFPEMEKYQGNKIEEPFAFDCRIFQTDDDEDINRVLTWRRCDAINNSKQMWAQQYFTAKQLHGYDIKTIMLNLKELYGVDWNTLPTLMKRGCYLQNPEWTWQSEFHESDDLTKQYETYLMR